MWVRGGRLWLSKTIFKPNIKTAKVQDSLLKTNERNFENILFFDPKYVWALATSKRWKHCKTWAEKPWDENRHQEKNSSITSIS